MSKKIYNICAVVQHGRLEYEAIIFALSFRAHNPDFEGRLIFLEPQPSEEWAYDPRMQDAGARDILLGQGAEIIPFENRHFGSDYPHSNKILGLRAMPADQPFVFFDTDTIFTGPITQVPFDFTRPMASMKREATWPEIDLYGPSYAEIWKALYDKFDLDFETSLDMDMPAEHWRRYLYFNAGFFFYKCPREFGDLFFKYASEIDANPPEQLETQSLRPWLDQVALPLVIHTLGGGRDTLPSGLLDGEITTHYRVMSLFYATAPDTAVEFLEQLVAPNKFKKVLKNHEPFKKLIFQRKGHKIRPLFNRQNLPRSEEVIRKRLKNHKLWMR
ncbi:hypothetical protein GCM10007939_09040 [Amylibacter marinus]|uniref:Rhamnan synthesis protein F n=1 Tax=Amylibacter marinus TaxID=1475483 RepID=A0ABQ5VTB9_9RHOB|nr:hypothetical protein [Amylibacter marinus]GLQ34621.1 hypothetical protein GCM10007939_09040 [Amylibacter marinus]